ncbi:armadillo-type protein [Phlyctochytrium arcticum]|nr:armadillo-type protein [Phlyctochytrium arcticum]
MLQAQAARIDQTDVALADQEVVVQSLRALANLCYENDSNRERVLEAGGISSIVGCLNASVPKIVITAGGALTNISMDNEPIQVEALEAKVMPCLLGALKRHLELPLDIQHEHTGDISTAVIQVLSNLLEIEKGVNELLAADGLKLLLQLLKYKHEKVLHRHSTAESFENALKVLDALTTVLEAVSENDSIQRAIVSQDLLDILLDFVDHRLPEATTEQQKEEASTYADIRKTVSRIVTLVTMNDANMYDLPKKKEIIERFKRWMTNGAANLEISEEDEIRMSGALCVGNLARSDETCVKLVKEYAVDKAVVELLGLEIERMKQQKPDQKSTIKVLHAVVGSLKNLTLAAANRPVMGTLPVVERVADLYELPGIKPVQYGAVGVLKNLCGGDNDANAYRIVTGQNPPAGSADLVSWPVTSTPGQKTPLNRVVSLIWSATGDNDTGIRNEGGRLLVNLVRAAHRSKAIPFLKFIVDSNALPPLVQIITGALLTKPREVDSQSADDEHHVHFDAVPVEGQVFPMVQNEGILSLILIHEYYPEAVPKITRFASSLLVTLVDILKSGTKLAEETSESQQRTYADETKSNICILLRCLINADEAFQKRAATTDLSTVLKLLSRSASQSNSPVLPRNPLQTLVHAKSASGEIGRSGTVSAKNLVNQGPSRRELQATFEAAAGEAPSGVVDSGLREAAGALLLVL